MKSEKRVSFFVAFFNVERIRDTVSSTLHGEKPVSIGGKKVNCLRYVDDTLIAEHATVTVQRTVDDGLEEYCIKIIVRKTKTIRSNDEEDMRVKYQEENEESKWINEVQLSPLPVHATLETRNMRILCLS